MRTTIIVIACVALAAAGAWFFWPRALMPPDAVAASPRDIHDYIASDHFAELPAHQQADYMRKLWEQPPERLGELMAMRDLPDEAREKVMRNVQRGMIRLMARDAAEFATLRDEARDAFVDKKIDEMMTKMRAVAAVGRPKGVGPPLAGGNLSADRMQKHIEKMLSFTTPLERAQLLEYRKHLMKRMWRRIGAGR